MLADEGRSAAHSGALSANLHLPAEWFSSLVRFISGVLPEWRDDPARPAATSEDNLSAQLCTRLNSVCRHTPGWDFLQFRREEPDEIAGNRAIDLVPGTTGETLWINGRAYNEYQSLLPIECKRLPTPTGPKRDAREYLFSAGSSTGGVQRFKTGKHGAAHSRAAMIAYVQAEDVLHWRDKIDTWIDGLVAESVSGWSVSDKFILSSHDASSRTALLSSTHERTSDLPPVLIDHVWIEM